MTHSVVSLLDGVEVGEMNFCIVLLAFLKMFTRYSNLGVRKVPPVGESFAVVKPGILTRNVEVVVKALKHSSVVDRLHNLERVSPDQKVVSMNGGWVVDHILPLACTSLVLHPVPIGTFLFVGVVVDSAIAMKVDRRLTMLSAQVLSIWAPPTSVSPDTPTHTTCPFIGVPELQPRESKRRNMSIKNRESSVAIKTKTNSRIGQGCHKLLGSSLLGQSHARQCRDS